MKQVSLVMSLALLCFCVACGSSNSNSGPTPSGNFSNASLNGQYVYQLTGFDLGTTTSTAYVRSGVFTADGNGGITSGTDDFSEGTVTSTAITGTYSISSDGTGTLTLGFPSGSITLAITVQSSSNVYLIETDVNLVGAGTAELQNTGAFANAPQGTFAFRRHDVSTALISTSAVGALTISGGAVTGNEDLNVGGTVSSPTVTGGLFNVPDPTTGRGTASITDNNGATTTFNYYVVDANDFRLLNTTSGSVGIGRAEMQTTNTFSNASIAGDYAFGARGDTINNFNGLQLAGRYTADGNGNISAGAFDSLRDGVASAAAASFTGTYSVASNGRATVTINASGTTAQRIYWLVSPSHAFFLTDDPNTEAEGTVDLQQGTFSTSSFVGQYALLMTGFDFTPETLDRVATLQFDGAGHLTLNEFLNASGTVNAPGFLGGSYSVTSGSNGRVTGSITGLTNNIDLVFYFSSASNGYVIQSDSNTEIGGMVSKQQ